MSSQELDGGTGLQQILRSNPMFDISSHKGYFPYFSDELLIV
jgi:hypothetical protein